MLPQKTMLSLWDSLSALLAAQGFSTKWLFIGIAVFFVILLLSLREFLCWYLKIYQTQKMLEELKTEIASLKNNAMTQVVVANPQKEEAPKEPPTVDRFVHFN